MDNCSIHLGKEIEKLINQVGARLIYLPPYSPEFSPIENFWSKVKSILRSLEARTYSDLEKALEEAFEQVFLKDIENWFANCCLLCLTRLRKAVVMSEATVVFNFSDYAYFAILQGAMHTEWLNHYASSVTT
jgi:hypothetical protein